MTGTTEAFRAYRIHDNDGQVTAAFETLGIEDLSEGEVVIRAEYSDVNYKDALAATGEGKILRRFPLVGGIDVAGVIESSSDERFQPGDAVVVTGCGLGEDRDGGYAEFVRAPADGVIPLPAGFTTREAMMLGTAGFTAALAIHRMEHNGVNPDGGPVVVTGATGGVGSLAVNMLAGRGYEVVAVTGKQDSIDYLKALGASSVLLRQDIDYGKRPLEKARWQGAVDNVGGEMLTWLTRTTSWWGSIASIGLAGSHKLETTVMPFILRGVNLLGINSMATPRELRLDIWKRIGSDLKPAKLDAIVAQELPFDELASAFRPLLDGKQIGRTVIRIG
ncbi:MAG: oxidoreductase [Gammaproteobacteria bacterium]|nr:oxidoreductase [Gammaproteobacteria bacterium]